MNRILIISIFLIAAFPVCAADGFSSLEEQMNGKEYSAAGLDKLTPAELEALNNWIRSHSIATLDKPKAGSYATTTDPAVDNRGLKNQEDEDRSRIESRLIGTFSGWDGKTVFKLENGMIWEQDDNDKYYATKVENPKVTIKPGMFGTWRIKVEGYNTECRVERVQ